jgi:hypothetical protein
VKTQADSIRVFERAGGWVAVGSRAGKKLVAEGRGPSSVEALLDLLTKLAA